MPFPGPLGLKGAHTVEEDGNPAQLIEACLAGTKSWGHLPALHDQCMVTPRNLQPQHLESGGRRRVIVTQQIASQPGLLDYSRPCPKKENLKLPLPSP